MGITLPNLGSPISADLMYQFYDSKAITPQIRLALQKRDEAEAKEAGESSSSKFGPAARVDITQEIIRMNIEDKTPSMKKEEQVSEAKSNRYDALTEIRKRLAREEAEAKAKEAEEK